MTGDVHLYLRTVPALGDDTFLLRIQVHTQYRTHAHLKEVVLGFEMQRGIYEREVEVALIRSALQRIGLGIVGAPLADILMPVQLIVGQCVQLQSVVLQVEVQILTLATGEQRIALLCLMQTGGYIAARIGLDGSIGLDNTVRSEFLQEVVYLRVLQRHRNPLRLT